MVAAAKVGENVADEKNEKLMKGDSRVQLRV